MPASLVRFRALSLATRGLLAGKVSWKAPLRSSTSFDFQFHISRRLYASIADAMLGRAIAKEIPPPPKKNELAKQLFPSSSPAQDGNIEDGFKKARQSTQSIGGFVRGVTNTTNPLRPRSPNKQGIKRKSDSMSSTSSAMSKVSGGSVFSRVDSFHDTQSTMGVQDTRPTSRQLTVNQCSQAIQGFDENDFDSDPDLDFEPIESMPAPPKPASQKLPIQAPTTSSEQLGSHNPSSGAITWSSSPASHLAPPPSRQEQYDTPVMELDPDPPTKKLRRTLPWAQKKAEEDQLAAWNTDKAEMLASQAASSSAQAMCFKCKKLGHYVKDCPTNGKIGKAYEYTPLLKNKAEKPVPWNHTAEAMGLERKLFNKASKKKLDDQKKAVDRHTTTKKVVMAPVTLSDEQKRVQNLVINDSKSVFFTGSAGTGKSVLMRSIIQELRKKYVREPDRIAVTASTGLAACNIGGVTLHSFGGIGLGKEDVPTLVKKIKRNPKAKNRWIKTKILIIDEISMVDGDLFDKLEGIARAMRNNGRPFGGIQLVITGDFFQLPPVPDYDNKARGAKFAFDAGTWNTTINHTIGLTEVFRQKDPVFANMLNEMRLGKISEETVRAFKQLSREVVYSDHITTTELFPTRNEVDNANNFKMRSMKGKCYTYPAVDSGTITDETMRDKLLSNMMAPKLLEVKKGAQVMLIKNMDDTLVNGSLGVVMSFMSETKFDIYDKHSEAFDFDIPDEELEDTLRDLRTKYASRNKDSLPDTGRQFPVVRFSLGDGNSRDLLVQPEEWKVELPNGEVQAQRQQLPLILAWALSIHKAQGQTLERVKIDLKRIFEKGQAYVALSRATSQAGLVVQNFDKNKVMAHPRVAQFYNSLYSVNKALEHPKLAARPNNSVTQDMDLKRRPTHIIDLDDEEEMMRAYG